MAQRFPDRDAADLKLCSDGILAKLLALAKFTTKNLFSQTFNNCSGERLPRDRGGMLRRQCR